jgi:hypothetical protein
MIEHRWSVDVFHVRDEAHQQMVLEALDTVERDVIGFGTRSGHYAFVIVETNSLADRVLVWQTIRKVDVRARKSYSFRPRQAKVSRSRAPAG